MNLHVQRGVFAVAEPPMLKVGDKAVTAEGSVLGTIVDCSIDQGLVGVIGMGYVSAPAHNHIADEVNARLEALSKENVVSEVMQEVVAALVAEVNRLEADLARERGEKDLLLGKYIELATKVADHVAGVEKPAVVPSFAESACQETSVT